MATERVSQYARLLKSVIRNNESPEEHTRSSEACGWMVSQMPQIRAYLDTPHIEILQVIASFWYNEKVAPSREILEDTLALRQTSTADLQITLEEALDEAPGAGYQACDLSQVVSDLGEAWRSERVLGSMQRAKAIMNGGWDDPTRGGKSWHGPRDAAAYLLSSLPGLATSTFSSSNSPANARDLAGELKAIYDKIEEEKRAGRLGIPIGIPEIEDAVLFRPGDLIGILGFPGQRKSSVCRTMAYNAVAAGKSVYYTSLEQSIEEEMAFFALIHATKAPKYAKYRGKLGLSKRKFDRGELTEQERRFLYEEVIPDIQQGTSLSGNLVFDPGGEDSTWPALKSRAEIQDSLTPFDFWILDYLAVGAKGGRDETTTVNGWIRDAKQTAMHWHDGSGLALVTPVQGNRQGWERAKERGGIWDMSGVYMYSEVDKTFDTILSVFMDMDEGEVTKGTEITISSAKIRRGAPIRPFSKQVSDATGALGLDEKELEKTASTQYLKTIGEEAVPLPDAMVPDF